MYILERKFEIEGSALPLSTFNSTAVASQGLVESLTSKIFGEDISMELYVIPPSEGSFIQRLGILVVSGAVTFNQTSQFLDTDIGRTLYEEIVEELPAETARKWGKYIDGQFDKMPPVKDLAEEVIGNVHQFFLKSDLQSLQRKKHFSPRTFPTGHVLRNNFYEACLEQSEIASVAFPPFDDPVDKSSFVDMRAMLPRDLPTELFENAAAMARQVETLSITITSPNWDRNDHQRMWKGRDNLMRRCFFSIEDDHFGQMVQDKKIGSDVINQMVAQVSFLPGASTMKNARVLRVLDWNGKSISPELHGASLRAALASLSDDTLDNL